VTIKLQPIFSHIYIEEEAHDYPISKKILAKYPNSQIITIPNYQALFNRNRQNWTEQKLSRKLILAVKKDQLVYKGSDITPSFGHKNFYYTSPILNCLYDCEYCYLQGMFESANIVMFVNEDSFLNSARKLLLEQQDQNQQTYLCISYDSDILVFDYLHSWVSSYHQLLQENSNLLIELRTKSTQISSLEKLEPLDNLIVAWTLSPQTLIEKFEHKTPSLLARLKAAQKLAKLGYPIRICLDPILDCEQADKLYLELLDQIFSFLRPEQIRDISLGTFRISSAFYKTLKKARPDSTLSHYPYTQSATRFGTQSTTETHCNPLQHNPAKQESYFGYSTTRKNQIITPLLSKLQQHLPIQKIFTV